MIDQYYHSMGLFGKDKNSIQKQHSSAFNTEQMLKFSEIRGSTMLLKDGGLRCIIKAQGLNLDLRSYDEQLQVIEGYKRFLNGLNFPIQIIVHNAYLDLSNYITSMKDKIRTLNQSALQTYGKEYVSFLDDINIKEGLVFVKEFYIVIPYYDGEEDQNKIRKPRRQKFLDSLDAGEGAEKIVARYRNFGKNKKLLDTRVSLVVEGLRGIGITCEILDSQTIIQLLFKFHNPGVHSSQAVYHE